MNRFLYLESKNGNAGDAVQFEKAHWQAIANWKSTPFASQWQWTSFDGTLYALFGAVFAVLGLLSFGLVFLPFAAAFSLASWRRSRAKMSAVGIGAATLATMLTIIGVAASPTVWIVIFALVKTVEFLFNDGIY